MHVSQFSTAVGANLQAGDQISMVFSSAITKKVMAVNQFSGLVSVSSCDQVNTVSGNSTTPGTTASVTTTQTDELLLAGAVVVNGPDSEGFTEDESGFWTSLARVGTSGGLAGDNLTLNAAYRPVTPSATYRYLPTLGVSRTVGRDSLVVQSRNAVDDPGSDTFDGIREACRIGIQQ